MVLILHILIAMSSIGYTGYVLFRPSKNKFYAAYALVGATLVTGTYLVILKSAHLVSACMTGIVYLGFTTAGLVIAHKRLAAEEV